MARPPRPLTLHEGDEAALQALIRHPRAENRHVQRARIVLLASQGLGTEEIAERVGVVPETVCKWKRRYREAGFGSLTDAPRSGRPRTVTDAMVEQVVQQTLETAPKGATHWSTRGLARRLSMSKTTVARIWQAFRLQPHRQETFELTNDPYFVDKVRDVVGLYLDPPERAVVFSVDEKTQIQALERTQAVLPLGVTKCRAISPTYSRHGTTDLFAALDVATGYVLGACYPEHRSEQFIDFLRQIDDEVPDKELDIHIILDNASFHRSAETLAWVLRHPRFHLHYTPTYASWLNLVEGVFSKLYQQQLRFGVHTSVQQLIDAIHAFLDANNEHPKPFRWTKTADQILERVARFCGGVLDRHATESPTPDPSE